MFVSSSPSLSPPPPLSPSPFLPSPSPSLNFITATHWSVYSVISYPFTYTSFLFESRNFSQVISSVLPTNSQGSFFVLISLEALLTWLTEHCMVSALLRPVWPSSPPSVPSSLSGAPVLPSPAASLCLGQQSLMLSCQLLVLGFQVPPSRLSPRLQHFHELGPVALLTPQPLFRLNPRPTGSSSLGLPHTLSSLTVFRGLWFLSAVPSPPLSLRLEAQATRSTLSSYFSPDSHRVCSMVEDFPSAPALPHPSYNPRAVIRAVVTCCLNDCGQAVHALHGPPH